MYKLFFFGYLIAIILLSVFPLNSGINNTYLITLRLDYLLHTVIYLPWAFLFYRGLQRNAWLALATGIVAGTLLEGVQYLLPYRAFNINDLLANVLGVGVGMVGIFLRLEIRDKRSTE